MTLNTFLEKVKSKQKVSFDETMVIINEYYQYTPTTFSNGLGDNTVINEAGTNEGSCKIFAFAKLHQLNQTQTLNLFGDFYQDVLNAPNGSNHQNIRYFIKSAWEGIKFNSANILSPK